MKNNLTPQVANLIYHIRDKRVMLDSDLAELYNVKTKRLNEQVKRNQKRFPHDFAFQLSAIEWKNLRSQFATANSISLNKRRSLPYVFTEHGAVMLASILDSSNAINASVKIVRAFVKMQSLTHDYKNLQDKIESMELRYDNKFQEVFLTLKEMINNQSKFENNKIKKGIKE